VVLVHGSIVDARQYNARLEAFLRA